MNTVQTITSEKTSISTINRIFKLLPNMGYKKETLILDYGCGKYNQNKEEAEKNGYIWLGFDPYNRSQKDNFKTLTRLINEKPDVVVCNNVLNVIYEDKVIQNVLNTIYNYSDDNTDIYITIYEGNKSGIGMKTIKGYQRNCKVNTYTDIISEWFDIVGIIKPNIIKCRKIN